MTEPGSTIDISDQPDVRRLAQRVNERREAIALRADNRTIAILIPAPQSEIEPAAIPTEADYEDTLSTFGAWNGLVDTEQLKANAKAARGSKRPPVDL